MLQYRCALPSLIRCVYRRNMPPLSTRESAVQGGRSSLQALLEKPLLIGRDLRTGKRQKWQKTWSSCQSQVNNGCSTETVPAEAKVVAAPAEAGNAAPALPAAAHIERYRMDRFLAR